jgi:hypothetical protein
LIGADPVSLLVDDALVASWIRQGLPSDPTSIGNGTILVNSERWPLMMDPQLQGALWIKERESKNGLQVGNGRGGSKRHGAGGLRRPAPAARHTASLPLNALRPPSPPPDPRARLCAWAQTT